MIDCNYYLIRRSDCNGGVGQSWSSHMLVRPRDLADQMSPTHQIEVFYAAP